MEINTRKSILDYRIRKDKIIRYLMAVPESEDWKEYQNHKVNLNKICSSPEEYEKSIKCLADIMGI